MERRDFIKSGTSALVISLGFTSFFGACTAISGLSSAKQVSSKGFDVRGNKLIIYRNYIDKTFDNIGSAKLSYIDPDTLERVKLIVVKTYNGEFFAFENRCPHCGRELDFNRKSNSLNCVSIAHSKFELTGEVLKGPAKERLRIYPCTYNKNQVTLLLDQSS